MWRKICLIELYPDLVLFNCGDENDLSFQYIIPITVILFTHTKIIGIVRQRTTRTTTMTGSARAEVTMRRNKKTTQVSLAFES